MNSCPTFTLILVIVAVVIQAVLIGTRWWGTQPTGLGSSPTNAHLVANSIGLFKSTYGSSVVNSSGKAKLAQTLSTSSMVLVAIAALLVACLVAHRSTVPSCGVKTGSAVLVFVAFGVSLTASIFNTRFIKGVTGTPPAKFGVAVALHYVSSFLLLPAFLLLWGGAQGNPAMSG